MTTYLNIPTFGTSPFWGSAVSSAAALPGSGQVTGEIVFVLDEEALYYWDGASWEIFIDGLADVSGPASSTDDAIARFDGTTGKVIQNSAVTIDNSGNALGFGSIGAVSATFSGAVAADSASLTTPLPVASGGTNSGAALSNNRVMRSSGGAVVEAAAITASRALESDANGIPVASAVTATELGYVSGVTSAIQTQIDTKVTGPASATDHAFARYDLTTGKLVQDSGVICDDSNNVTGVAQINTTLAKVGATGALTTSATLEVAGTTGAFLLPRLTTAERDALTATAGMMVFNTTDNRPQIYIAAPDAGWYDFLGWGSP